MGRGLEALRRLPTARPCVDCGFLNLLLYCGHAEVGRGFAAVALGSAAVIFGPVAVIFGPASIRSRPTALAHGIRAVRCGPVNVGRR